MKNLIELKGITKSFPTGDGILPVLKDINLSVRRGEFVTIVGSSGSGKSTLMNIIGCLDTPDSGDYLLDGEPVADLSDRRLSAIRNRKIGFVFAERMHHLPSQLSGDQQQRTAIARAVASRPPVILADEPTGNLDSASGGEIMRLLHGLHENGTTIILITHDPAVAAAAPRRICFADGRISREECFPL